MACALLTSAQMLYAQLLGLLSVVALPTLAAGCSDHVTFERESSGLAITLQNGRDFLQSVDGNKVVLLKKVRGVALPFRDDEFQGKNIVIHPSSLDVDDGLFARVTEVEPSNDRLTLTVRALDLAEMADAARNGDDTLTIFRNPRLEELPSTFAQLKRSTGTPGLKPLGVPGLDLSLGTRSDDPSDSTTSTTPSSSWPPTIGGFTGLNKNFIGFAGATFKPEDMSFTPGLSAKWIDGGFELGADMKLNTKFKIEIKGAVAGATPVYENVKDEKLLVVAKGGPVTLFEAPVTVGGVYTTFGVKGGITCFARVEQKFAGTLNVDMGAALSGSVAVRVTKQSDSDPTISEGDIPFDVSGHADVSFDAELGATTPSIYCEVPKLAAYVIPGGRIAEKLGGPQASVGIAGRFYGSWDGEPTYKVQTFAAVSAEPFGRPIGAELVLHTYVP